MLRLQKDTGIEKATYIQSNYALKIRISSCFLTSLHDSFVSIYDVLHNVYMRISQASVIPSAAPRLALSLTPYFWSRSVTPSQRVSIKQYLSTRAESLHSSSKSVDWMPCRFASASNCPLEIYIIFRLTMSGKFLVKELMITLPPPSYWCQKCEN